MKLKQYFLYVIGFLLFLVAGVSIALPVFPGAQGAGTDTVAGRGGTVIKVTNLNDSGEGSFRAAVTSSFPRIIVFDVSGIINLNSQIEVNNPYMTIAGQTSPAGIIITGNRFKINTHDVLIRYIQFRIGSHGNVDPNSSRAWEIYGNGNGRKNAGYNVVMDHISSSWSADQVGNVAEDAYDVTISWSIVGEGLQAAGHPEGGHSYGMFFWGKYTHPSRRFSLHHNYFPHNGGRNPEINYNGNLNAVNNITYGFTGGKTPKSAGDAKVNWIHNFVRGSVDSNKADEIFEVRDDNTGSSSDPRIYVEGNIGSRRTSQSDPEQWYVGFSWRNELLSESLRSMTPVTPNDVTVTPMTEEYAREILETVGSSVNRDSADDRMISDFINGTGSLKDNVSFPEDFPVIPNPAPNKDLDSDGMADEWELVNGFDTSVDDSAADKDGNGYTNIEEYLHFLAAGGRVVAYSPAVPPPGFQGQIIK